MLIGLACHARHLLLLARDWRLQRRAHAGLHGMSRASLIACVAAADAGC
jgi:hypothetical protein